MRAPLFFICLCFILLKVGAPLSAFASSPAGLAPAVLPSGFFQAADHQQDPAILTVAGESDRTQLVFDDAEDEDANELFARKFKLIARCYPDLFLQNEPGCPINRSKAAPSFFGRVSYKYLLQRVLRV